MQKCVKLCQNSEIFWRSNDFPGGSKISWASEGPQKGGKTTGMDIPEFRDINGPAPMPKNDIIGQIVAWGCKSPPPLPVSLGLRKRSAAVYKPLGRFLVPFR